MPNLKNIKTVEMLTEKLSNAKSIFFTDYLGLNVADVTNLRKEFYSNDVEYMVVKNTLLKLASKNNKYDLEDGLFSGSTAIAISYDEPVVPAKVLKNFLKGNNELPKVKGMIFEGNYLSGEEFESIANLPSKEESLNKMVSMLNSPLQNLARMIKSPMSDFVTLLKNINQKNNK